MTNFTLFASINNVQFIWGQILPAIAIILSIFVLVDFVYTSLKKECAIVKAKRRQLDNIASLRVVELKTMARAYGIKLPSKIKKYELQNLLIHRLA